MDSSLTETSERAPLTAESGLPKPGAPFGHYDVLEELGRGAMGIVYRATHRSLQRACALKVLNLEGAGRTAAVRFLREGQAAARVGKHAHLVQVFDAAVVGDVPYIAMELVRGETLEARVRRGGPVPEREVLEIGRKLAFALDHVHRSGIVHRDLKPANILIDAAGEPHIADFGIARDLRSAQISVEGAVIGTPAFMAPEQADTARGETDRRSDIYGLGATLFFAASGRLPFEGKTASEVILQLLARDAPPLGSVASVGRDVEAVITRTLEKEPRRRYQTALELADDCSRVLAGEAPRARRVGPVGRLVRKALRNPGALVAVALALLASAAVSVVLFVGGREIDSLRSDLIRSSARATAIAVRERLAELVPTVEELSALGTAGFLPLDDPDALIEQLAVRFRYRSVDRLAYVDGEGRIIGVSRRQDGAVVIHREGRTPGRLSEDVLAPDGSRAPGGEIEGPSRDRLERWGALVARSPGVAWSAPEVDADPRDRGLWVASAVRGRGVTGTAFVVAGIEFERLGAVLDRVLTSGTRGSVFLLDRGGSVVAAPGDDRGENDPRDGALIEAALLAAERPIAELALGDTTRRLVRIRGTAYDAALTAFAAADGLELVAAVVIPLGPQEDEASAQGDWRRVWGAGFGTALFAVGTLLLVARGRRRRCAHDAARGATRPESHTPTSDAS